MLKPVCSVIVICLGVAFLQYRDVETYMDEIFHIPQARKYCSGDFFHWDGKITTFPGLYLLSAATHGMVSKCFKQLLGHEIHCTVIFLRLLNVCISFLSFLLYKACRLKIEPNAGDSIWVALSLFLYPVNFFYYFLFYTDTASTFSILIVYYLALSSLDKRRKEPSERKDSEMKRSYFTSNFFSRQQLLLVTASSASVMMRQTNAIWLLFVTGTTMITILQEQRGFRDSQTPSISKLIEFLRNLLENVPYLLSATWPLLVPFLAFIGFVIANKGIVVGDKEHHKPVYHLAMPLHVCVIYTAFMLPLSLGTPKFTSSLKTFTSRNNDTANSSSSSSSSRVVRKSKSDDQVGSHSHSDSSSSSSSSSQSDSSSSGDASRSVTRFKILSVLGHVAGMVLVTYALQHHTLSHPFLLADNRHYSFYIWSRILSRPKIRYLLSPLYYYSVQWTVKHFIHARGFLWTVIFGLAAVITLVPAHLFELRYFSPAMVIAVISSSPSSQCSATGVEANEKEAAVLSKSLDNVGSERGPDSEGRNSLSLFGQSHLPLNVCLSCLVNIVTISLFLYRPFKWSDGTIARFMY